MLRGRAISMPKKRFLHAFSVFDIIIIAMCAGLGIAVKPVLAPLVHIVTGPLMIPGGAVAGGLYMLFIVVPAGLLGKTGAATLTCAVQALLVILTGVIGSHGLLSVVTYILPGIAVDLLMLTVKRYGIGAFICFFAGLLANATGTLMSNIVFFRLPFVPLMLVLSAAALSGGIGGLIAWRLIRIIKRFYMQTSTKEGDIDEE